MTKKTKKIFAIFHIVFSIIVIFEGNKSHIGNLANVRIYKSNQNTLFGKLEKNMKAA